MQVLKALGGVQQYKQVFVLNALPLFQENSVNKDLRGSGKAGLVPLGLSGDQGCPGDVCLKPTCPRGPRDVRETSGVSQFLKQSPTAITSGGLTPPGTQTEVVLWQNQV